MTQYIAHIAIVVQDYDEAIAYYTDILGFDLIEDTTLSAVKRWVLVAPPGAQECAVLLAKASTSHQTSRVGDQTGGRVGFFLYTDDIQRDYALYRGRGVKFIRPITTHDYGTVAVFEDLYGNKWDLLQPTSHNSWPTSPA